MKKDTQTDARNSSARRGPDELESQPRHPRRTARGGMLAVGLAAMGLLAAACSGGGSGPGVAGANGTTATTAASSTNDGGLGSGPTPKQEAELLKFSQCMQSHGLPDFPDPSNGGIHISGSPGSDLNPQSPTFQAAQSACKKYMPGANLTPAQKAAANAQALKYAECMRSHGVPDFPDPNGQGVIQITGGQGSDLNPNSSQFQHAQSACKSLSNGFQMQISTSGPGPGGPSSIAGNSGSGSSVGSTG
jgi:hypothetical protein